MIHSHHSHLQIAQKQKYVNPRFYVGGKELTKQRMTKRTSAIMLFYPYIFQGQTKKCYVTMPISKTF